MPVYPWGGISHALNLLVHLATQLRPTHILFQSPEIKSNDKHMAAMLSRFQHGLFDDDDDDDHHHPYHPFPLRALWVTDVLCVGGALKEHAQLKCESRKLDSPHDNGLSSSPCSEWTLVQHEDAVQESRKDGLTSSAQGTTIPWNTFGTTSVKGRENIQASAPNSPHRAFCIERLYTAMWDLDKLTRTGFMSLSDIQDPPGMEESAVFAAQQRLFPRQSRVELLHFESPGKCVFV